MPNIEPGSDEVAKWLPIAAVLSGPVPLFPPANYTRWLEPAGPY